VRKQRGVGERNPVKECEEQWQQQQQQCWTTTTTIVVVLDELDEP